MDIFNQISKILTQMPPSETKAFARVTEALLPIEVIKGSMHPALKFQQGTESLPLKSKQLPFLGKAQLVLPDNINLAEGAWLKLRLPETKLLNWYSQLQSNQSKLLNAQQPLLQGQVKAYQGEQLLIDTPRGMFTIKSDLRPNIGQPLELRLLNSLTMSMSEMLDTTRFKIGEKLNATIAEKDGPHLILQTSKGKLAVKSEFPLRLGTNMEIEISNKNQINAQLADPRNAIVKISGALKEVSLQALSQLKTSDPVSNTQQKTIAELPAKLLALILPKQQPLRQVINQLYTTHQSSNAASLLANYAPTKQAIAALNIQIPSLPSILRQPASILPRALIAAAQQISPSQLASLANSQTNPTSIQLALLNLTLAYKGMAQTIQRQVELPSIPQNFTGAPRFPSLQSLQLAEPLILNNEQLASTSVKHFRQLAELTSQLMEFSKLAEAGLARQKANQLNLNRADTSPHGLAFELPLKLPSKVDTIDFSFEEQKKKKKSGSQALAVTLSFDLDKLGKVKAAIRFGGDKTVNTAFYAEQPGTHQLLDQTIGKLQESLQKKGINVDSITTSRQAKSADKPGSIDEQIINIKV